MLVARVVLVAPLVAAPCSAVEQPLVFIQARDQRTPMRQGNVRIERAKGFTGQDHHPFAFTMSVSPYARPGSTPPPASHMLAYYIGRDKVTIGDLQATILHQFGLDPHRFHYAYQGLNNRVIGPTDEGKVVKGILG